MTRAGEKLYDADWWAAQQPSPPRERLHVWRYAVLIAIVGAIVAEALR